MNDSTNIPHSTWNTDKTPSPSPICFTARRVLNTKKTDKFIEEISQATKFAKLAIEQANVRNADNADNTRKEEEFKLETKSCSLQRTLH